MESWEATEIFGEKGYDVEFIAPIGKKPLSLSAVTDRLEVMGVSFHLGRELFMIRKTYLKTGRSCRVTFELSPEVDVESACVCGEFNGWDETAHPMKRRKKDGRLALTISLKPGQAYRFRYLLDGERWENDSDADAYVANPFGSDDSVVEV